MILAKPAAQSFGYNFLGTYVHALNRENYARGANFAYSGASARADTTITPFYLKLQIDQYIYFKKIYQTPGYRTLFFLTLSLPMDGWQWQVYDDFEPLLRSNWFLQITCHSRKGLIATQLASFPSSMSFVTQIYFESIEVCCDWLRMWWFRQAAIGLYEPESDAFTSSIHFISEIGGNDVTIAAIYDHLTPAQIISTILPQSIAAVRDALVVRSLHITSTDDITYSRFFYFLMHFF